MYYKIDAKLTLTIFQKITHFRGSSEILIQFTMLNVRFSKRYSFLEDCLDLGNCTTKLDLSSVGHLEDQEHEELKEKNIKMN